MGEALGFSEGGSRFPRFIQGQRIAPYVGPELKKRLENPLVFQSSLTGPKATSHGYNGNSHERMDCQLVLTSVGCPEQYDVYRDGKQIGYLRLRHGVFTAERPDCVGELVYEANPEGDGCFVDDERDKYLDKAVSALLSAENAA